MKMKQLLCTMMSILLGGLMTAQNTALVYSLPTTMIVVEIEYEEIHNVAGPFFQYSERYLGVKQPIAKDDITFELKGIHVNTKGIPTEKNSYFCTDINGTLPNLQLSKEGILLGINTSLNMSADATLCAEEPILAESTQDRLVPFLEEQMLASSLSKQAESTAKMIYHIRDSRIALLSGEVEKMPTDMATVLGRLDEEENILCSQFVGKQIRQRRCKTLTYIPTALVTDSIIARFSQFEGIVDSDDLSGSPISLKVEPSENKIVVAADKKVKHSNIYYNVPGHIHMEIAYNGIVLVDTCIATAQFGTTLELPIDCLTEEKHITFDPATGALLQITK